MLKNQSRGFDLKDKCASVPDAYFGITNDIEKPDDVDTTGQVLKDLDLSLDFLLFYRLENFDDALFVGVGIDAFEDFRVLPATNLFDDLVVVLITTSWDLSSFSQTTGLTPR